MVLLCIKNDLCYERVSDVMTVFLVMIESEYYCDAAGTFVCIRIVLENTYITVISP